jgi:hypothetical protein
MKHLLIFLLLCIATISQAQLSHYNSDAYWANFDFEANQLTPDHADTCLVFVTNRHVQPDSLRFVDEFVDTCALKYLLLQKEAGKWKVYQGSSLEEVMELLPAKRDLVVYAEGMGKIFTSNVERALLMSTQYGVNVIMFDYASINTTYRPSRNFRFARENAALSATQYFTLLKQLQQAKAQHAPWITGNRLSAFFHSMGNIILEQMMLHEPVRELNNAPFIDNVVINAACVPQKHHARWVEQILFANKVFIHYNRKDFQLKGAHFLTMKKQLGEKIRKPLAGNATYVNFHELVKWKHSYFLNMPDSSFTMPLPVANYFSNVLKGNDAVLGNANNSMLTQQNTRNKSL